MPSRIPARLATPIVVVALAGAAAPAIAFAGGSEPPRDAAQAQAALGAAEDALGADRDEGRPDRGATVALAELADALPALEGPDRRRARALLARPTDGAGDPFGDGYAPSAEVEHTESPAGNFCVTWVAGTEDDDAPDPADENDSGVPDYVEEIGSIAEHSYSVEVGELGWRRPVKDVREECGKPGQIDIYLKELGALGIFGYEATDPGQGNRLRKHGYLVIDNDYDPAQFPGFSTPLDAARVTVAHELNHLLQEGYDSRQDAWMFEATATWVEEKVYPEIDDYIFYVRRFASAPGAPITAFEGAGGLKVYGSAVWNHWLESGDRAYGPAIVRRPWEVSRLTKPASFAVGAYHRAIAGSGGEGMAREFVDFAAATAEWRTGDGGFPDAERYPDMRRQGTLRPRRPAAFKLDHTGYRLLRVPSLRAPRIRLTARAEPGVNAGIALVARRGGPVNGDVVRRVKWMPRGGRGAVALRLPRRFNRITAVVVNADGRVSGRPGPTRDWRYRKDDQRFQVRLIRRR